MDLLRQDSLFLEHRTCGDCESFLECSKRNVKNVRPKTNYCQWGSNRFKLSESIRKIQSPLYCESVDTTTYTQPQGPSTVPGWFDSIKEELAGNKQKDWKIIPEPSIPEMAQGGDGPVTTANAGRSISEGATKDPPVLRNAP